MEWNPYSPPGGPAQPPDAQIPNAGEPIPWEPGEVMGEAWRVFKLHWGALLGATFVAGLIQGMFSNVVNRVVGAALDSPLTDPEFMSHLDREKLDQLLGPFLIQTAIGTLILYPVTAFFRAGVVKLMLGAARGSTPQLAEVFNGGSRTMDLTLAFILKGLIIGIGFLLLIVPGIYASLALSQVDYFVVDRKMTAVDAIKASLEATKGQKGNLLLFGALSIGLILLGFLACCLGVLVATPVIELGAAMIFARLTGTAPPPESRSSY